MLGMTPATDGRGGAGMTVHYEITDCARGKLLVGATERGVCIVKLGDDRAQLESKLDREFPRAKLERQSEGLRAWVSEIVRYLAGETTRLDLPLDIQATAFQMRVWRALRGIARGDTKSYSQVAREIGSPRAARAVARACATHPVGIVSPCHRLWPHRGSPGGPRDGIRAGGTTIRDYRNAEGGRG